MRFTTVLCSMLLTSQFIEVAHTRPIDLEPVVASGAMWSDEVYMVGHAKVTLVASMGRNPERPAIWRAFDETGRELWRREHACPSFRDYAEVKLDGDLALCKLGGELVGLEVGTGEERWRFTSTRRLFMFGVAQGRVAVSVDNDELAVLDAKTGEAVLRLDTPGAVFEVLAGTSEGPFAVFVQNPPGRVERTVDLDLGDGPRKIVVSGLDPDRRLVAVAVGGSSKELQPLKPAWSVPFEGYSFEVIEAANALITQPSEGLRVAWDTRSGARLWAARIQDGDVAAFGRFGSVVAKNHGREWNYLGFAAGTNQMQWVESMPTKKLDPGTEEPLFLRVGGPRGVLVAPRHIRLFSIMNGKTEQDLTVPHGYSVTAAHLSETMLAFVATRGDSRRLHLVPLVLGTRR